MVALIFWAYRERQYQKHYRRRRFAQETLWFCLDNGLQLLHPFMSFVMEELWQRLPSPRECKRAESIMISCDYPSTIEATGFCSLPNTVVTEIINSHQVEIVTLANLSSLTVITENDAVPLGYADTVVNEKPFCLSRASKN
ncbi:Valine--tRNA ligase, mitochondrial 1 [Glycine soja]|nr:hypothetical protein JHK87_049078 [Glycine soja]